MPLSSAHIGETKTDIRTPDNSPKSGIMLYMSFLFKKMKLIPSIEKYDQNI
ncbi:MAG: hypothetical protein OEY17_02925 [Nitrosopumilus sp.]|nr:hypothetical protein [Nitrosopumilus sp.]